MTDWQQRMDRELVVVKRWLWVGVTFALIAAVANVWAVLQ